MEGKGERETDPRRDTQIMWRYDSGLSLVSYAGTYL